MNTRTENINGYIYCAYCGQKLKDPNFSMYPDPPLMCNCEKAKEELKLYDELKALVSFVVACRDGIKIDENLQKLDINVKISSSKIKSELNFKHIPTAILDSVEKFYKDKNAK